MAVGGEDHHRRGLRAEQALGALVELEPVALALHDHVGEHQVVVAGEQGFDPRADVLGDVDLVAFASQQSAQEVGLDPHVLHHQHPTRAHEACPGLARHFALAAVLEVLAAHHDRLLDLAGEVRVAGLFRPVHGLAQQLMGLAEQALRLAQLALQRVLVAVVAALGKLFL